MTLKQIQDCQVFIEKHPGGDVAPRRSSRPAVNSPCSCTITVNFKGNLGKRKKKKEN